MILEIFMSLFLLNIFIVGAEVCRLRADEHFKEALKPYNQERDFLWIKNPFPG